MKKIKILTILSLFFVVFSNFAITFYVSNNSIYPVRFYAHTPNKYIGSGDWETLAPGKETQLYDAGLASSISIYWQMIGKEYKKTIEIGRFDKLRLGKEFAILNDGGYRHTLQGGTTHHTGTVKGTVIMRQ